MRLIIIFALILSNACLKARAAAPDNTPAPHFGPSGQSAGQPDAYSYYLKGELPKAGAEYMRMAALEPANPEPLLNAAMCWRQAGQYRLAAQVMDKAAALAPDNPDIQAETGWLKFHRADYAAAKEAFELALRLAPDHERATLGLASVYSNLEDKDKTIELLGRYKQLRPDFAGVDYIIAWNYMNFKMYKEAEAALIEALRKDPTFTEARLPLAGIYARDGKFNEAWNQYHRVLDSAPGHPVASKAIKVLEGKLTKQPEEIRPPFKIIRPLSMEPMDVINSLSKSTKMRVGIGTGNTGKQGRNNYLKFKSFEGLAINGKRSGKLYAELPPDEEWTAEYSGERLVLKDSSGTVYGRFKGPLILASKDAKNGSVIFESSKKCGNPWFAFSDRQYRGAIELYPIRGRGLGVINILEMEQYLMGVVPSEVSAQWPYETLKAQAVIARTQAIIRRARGGAHKADGYHICDGEHCQAYKGMGNEANSTNRAVLDTEGELLLYHGKPAYTFYHSNCGGWIQASGEVRGWGDSPYLYDHPDSVEISSAAALPPWEFHLWLTGNPEANCNYPGKVRASEYRWMKIIKHKDLDFRVKRDYSIGDLREIVPLRRSRSGNVNSIKLVGSKKTITITKEHLIRNLLGFAPLKSTLFEIEINRFKDGRIRNYWFYGGGWGHAIGLCQSGAAGLAGKYNKNYREIIEFYFPGTALRKIKYIKKKG
ncbi:MAG: SpoIID/LytB domain-containing protein [Elusimicrobia bacterium]|nr:SpoIID/LytB domain-containing protein [Elusimicrobiota bacterium]